MSFLAGLHARFLSWRQGIPHPPTDSSTTIVHQTWHEFDLSSAQWCSLETPQEPTNDTTNRDAASTASHSFHLITWNVDSGSPLPEQRTQAILSQILDLSPNVDIIFFQELSHAAISSILGHTLIRQDWILSDTEGAIPSGQHFASMTLVSKARFQYSQASSQLPTLGPVWRVKYPSRFARDALCCDVFVPSSTPNPVSRVRLINVHLDSLPINPSKRPQQVSIIASFLRSAGRGIVAGDFNPVLPEDTTLVEDHELGDAWTELRPDDPGFTWGIDGQKPFPPNRMDKVVTLNLRALRIDTLHPGAVGAMAPKDTEEGPGRRAEGHVAWSDHSGISCTFDMSA